MKKQPQVTEQTKQNLRTAFWSLYEEKPIEKISVKEITNRAGYNRGTFYLYYKDVYDLFSQIEEELLETIRQVIGEALSKNDTFDLSHQMGFLMELVQTYSRYVPVLLSDRGDPKFVTRMKELIWPLLNRYFVPSQGHSAYEMGLLSEFYLSGVLSVIAKWLSEPQLTVDQFVAFMLPSVFPQFYSPADTPFCAGGTN